jgi:hypothetical protein
MPTTSHVRKRVSVACSALSMATVIALEILLEGDPMFSPFTTFSSGQIGGVVTIASTVVLMSASFCVLAPTVARAVLASFAVLILFGGGFVLNTHLFDAYLLDRERDPAGWYFFSVLPLSLAVLGLALGWLIAYRARGIAWLSLTLVLWVPILFRPLFAIALAGGDGHAEWQVDALTAFADAMTEAYEFALIVFLPVVLVIISSVLLTHVRSRHEPPAPDGLGRVPIRRDRPGCRSRGGDRPSRR